MIKKIRRENCWVGIQQRYCMAGMTRDLMKNIGKDWKEIGENRREK